MPPKTVAQKALHQRELQCSPVRRADRLPTNARQAPVGVTVSTRATGKFDLIQFFVTSAKELRQRLPKLTSRLRSGGLLWVTYPKGSSKIDSDISRDSIYNIAVTVGLKGVAMFALDNDWSAFRFNVVD